MDNKNQQKTEINSSNTLNINPILKKNKSIKNLLSNLKLKKLNNNYELPFIHSKIKIDKHDKSKTKLNKLSLNFVSYDYKNKLKLLSQITPLTKKIKKYYSTKEIQEFNKKYSFPMNYHGTMDNNISSSSSRNRKSLNLITRNSSDINDKSNLGIIDLSNALTIKEDTKISYRKIENKEKMSSQNCQRFINLKKGLEKILNPKGFKSKKYEGKKQLVHNYLFKTSLKNDDIMKNEDKNSDEIFPKFEYVNYFGTTQKLITRLTSNNKNNSEEKNYFNNNYLKLKLKLKSPDLIDYDNFDDYRNKKYIEQIQKKIKNKKKLEQEIIDDNKEFFKNLKEQVKINYEKLVENNKRSFDKYIYGALVEKNIIDNKLDNLIEIDKKIYENDFVDNQNQISN